MKRLIVQYKTHADRADENQALIEKVFEQLESETPAGLRYAAFRLEDGVSFVHIASIETDDGSNPLPETDSFKAFVADIKDRCEIPPAASEVQTIGAYRFAGKPAP